MNNTKIGIVGLGYVGGAIKNSYDRKGKQIETFDINKNLDITCSTLEELVNKVSVIYVCVPTPMNVAGECDISIVEQVVRDICEVAMDKTIVIKSTVVPGTTKRLQEENPKNTILFNPEFLTEANHKNDYLNQDVMLMGYVSKEHRETAQLVLMEQLQMVESVSYAELVDSNTAEFYKYLANIFLATKVSFANEMANVAKKLDIEWDAVRNIISHDNRMGISHWKVPGPDGNFGWGGSCFPKDLSAFIKYANNIGIEVPVLDAVWKRNVTVDRPQRDWEHKKI